MQNFLYLYINIFFYKSCFWTCSLYNKEAKCKFRLFNNHFLVFFTKKYFLSINIWSLMLKKLFFKFLCNNSLVKREYKQKIGRYYYEKK